MQGALFQVVWYQGLHRQEWEAPGVVGKPQSPLQAGGAESAGAGVSQVDRGQTAADEDCILRKEAHGPLRGQLARPVCGGCCESSESRS